MNNSVVQLTISIEGNGLIFVPNAVSMFFWVGETTSPANIKKVTARADQLAAFAIHQSVLSPTHILICISSSVYPPSHLSPSISLTV